MTEEKIMAILADLQQQQIKMMGQLVNLTDKIDTLTSITYQLEQRVERIETDLDKFSTLQDNLITRVRKLEQ